MVVMIIRERGEEDQKWHDGSSCAPKVSCRCIYCGAITAKRVVAGWVDGDPGVKVCNDGYMIMKIALRL
jgi:hypothetical protein